MCGVCGELLASWGLHADQIKTLHYMGLNALLLQCYFRAPCSLAQMLTFRQGLYSVTMRAVNYQVISLTSYLAKIHRRCLFDTAHDMFMHEQMLAGSKHSKAQLE